MTLRALPRPAGSLRLRLLRLAGALLLPAVVGSSAWSAAADSPYLRLGECVWIDSGHASALRDIAVLADTGLLVTAGADGVVKLWSTGAVAGVPQPIASADLGRPVLALDAAADGAGILALMGERGTGAERHIGLLRVTSDRRLVHGPAAQLDRDWRAVDAVLAPGDGGEAALVAGTGGRIELWSLKERRMLAQQLGGSGRTMDTLVRAAQGRFFAALGETAGLMSWQMADGLPTQRWQDRPGGAKLTAVAMSPGGMWIASGDAGGGIRLWSNAPDAASPETSLATRIGNAGAGDPITALAFSPAEAALLVGTRRGELAVLNLDIERPKGEALRIEGITPGHRTTVQQAPIRRIAFTADGKSAFIAGDGREICRAPVTGGR
jgi:WD40 repeat protein